MGNFSKIESQAKAEWHEMLTKSLDNLIYLFKNNLPDILTTSLII